MNMSQHNNQQLKAELAKFRNNRGHGETVMKAYKYASMTPSIEEDILRYYLNKIKIQEGEVSREEIRSQDYDCKILHRQSINSEVMY